MIWGSWQLPFFSGEECVGGVPSSSKESVKVHPKPTNPHYSRSHHVDVPDGFDLRGSVRLEAPSPGSDGLIHAWWVNVMSQHLLPPKLLRGGLRAWLESPRWSEKQQLSRLTMPSAHLFKRSYPSSPAYFPNKSVAKGNEGLWHYVQSFGQAIAEVELAQLGRTPFYWSALRCSPDLRRALEKIDQHFATTQHSRYAPLYVYCRELICLQFWREQLCQDFAALSQRNVRALDQHNQVHVQKLGQGFRLLIRTYKSFMEQSLQHVSHLAYALLACHEQMHQDGLPSQSPELVQQQILYTNKYIKHSLMGAELFRRAYHWLLQSSALPAQNQ